MDFSRPTKSGTIMCGNTTMSRSGRTGKFCVAPGFSAGRGFWVVMETSFFLPGKIPSRPHFSSGRLQAETPGKPSPESVSLHYVDTGHTELKDWKRRIYSVFQALLAISRSRLAVLHSRQGKPEIRRSQALRHRSRGPHKCRAGEPRLPPPRGR